MIVYSVFKPFILSMCVTNSYTIGSPSTDSSIELVFAPRNEALKCESAIYKSKDLVSCDDLYYMSINKYSNYYFMYKSFYFLDLKN